MASLLRTVVEKSLPTFFSKRVVAVGQAYKRFLRNKARIRMYGGDKPFTYNVCVEGVSFSIVLDPVANCVVDAEIAKSGCWEKELSAVFKRYLHEGDIFLDIGANIGYHSLFVASLLNGSGKVYSFEPIHRLANQLRKSIEVNNFQNIEVCNFGLAEHDDHNRTLYIRDENIGGSSLFRFENIELVKVKGTEKIELRKLDSSLEEGVKVNLIKIDVEGYEYEALKGAERILKSSHPIIVMEFSPIFYSQESSHKSDDLLSFLRNLGYSFYSLDGRPINMDVWLQEEGNSNSQIDILCMVSGL